MAAEWLDPEERVCPTCKGNCCRDTDFGYRVKHMGAECYEHHCDDCHDGQVPALQAQPDPRDALIAELRAEVEEHRKAQAAVYLALGTDETDRTKWPEQIKAMRIEVEKLREAVATDDDLMDSLREFATEDMLKIKALREAIDVWPESVHIEGCDACYRRDYRDNDCYRCDCYADKDNAARAKARKLVGLPEDPQPAYMGKPLC